MRAYLFRVRLMVARETPTIRAVTTMLLPCGLLWFCGSSELSVGDRVLVGGWG